MKQTFLRGLLYITFLAFLAAPAKSDPPPEDAPAVPVYTNMKDWIAAIQQTRPGLKLVVSTEFQPNILVAIFEAGNDCLVVCTYDTASPNAAADISFSIRDAAGHDLIDVPRAQQIKSDDLAKSFKITKPNGDTMVFRVLYGFYYPVANHYSGKARVVTITRQNGVTKTSEFPFTIDPSK